MLTRRQFTSAALSATALSGLKGFSGLYAAEPKKRASKYIDMHTHIGTTWNGNKELTPKGLLEWMDDHDVEKSVLLPLTSPESSLSLIHI